MMLMLARIIRGKLRLKKMGLSLMKRNAARTNRLLALEKPQPQPVPDEEEWDEYEESDANITSDMMDGGMGGAQAAGVLATVKRDAIERAGDSWTEEEETAFKQPTIDMFEEQSHPLYATARLWDDGVIDPRHSRDVLSLSLRASLNAPIEDTTFGVFRM